MKGNSLGVCTQGSPSMVHHFKDEDKGGLTVDHQAFFLEPSLGWWLAEVLAGRLKPPADVPKWWWWREKPEVEHSGQQQATVGTLSTVQRPDQPLFMSTHPLFCPLGQRLQRPGFFGWFIQVGCHCSWTAFQAWTQQNFTIFFVCVKVLGGKCQASGNCDGYSQAGHCFKRMLIKPPFLIKHHLMYWKKTFLKAIFVSFWGGV